MKKTAKKNAKEWSGSFIKLVTEYDNHDKFILIWQSKNRCWISSYLMNIPDIFRSLKKSGELWLHAYEELHTT